MGTVNTNKASHILTHLIIMTEINYYFFLNIEHKCKII